MIDSHSWHVSSSDERLPGIILQLVVQYFHLERFYMYHIFFCVCVQVLFKFDVCLTVLAKEGESLKRINTSEKLALLMLTTRLCLAGQLKAKPTHIYTCTMNKRFSVSGKYLPRKLWHFKDGH